MNKKILWILIFGFWILFSLKPLAHARRFQSDSYIIDWGLLNMTSGQKSSTNYNLTDTAGQIAPGQYTGSTYIVKAGFQYIYDTIISFSFVIDDLDIALGTLVPQVGSTQTNTITISTPSGNGYQIIAHENHPLQISPSVQIADTTGDNGLATESVSDTWTESDTYGFGFNAIGINNSGAVTGIGTSNYFSDGTYFRQFADYSTNETQQTIMSEDAAVSDRQARLSYKVNISTIQAAGNYQNAVTFTAVPKY